MKQEQMNKTMTHSLDVIKKECAKRNRGTYQHAYRCYNCNKPTELHDALLIYDKQRLIAVICPACQQAKKIQVTLERTNNKWEFSQYFPVEG
ncbi:MAG: hypothetical protein PVI90_03095 [Desulfobacteraceae bacterium]